MIRKFNGFALWARIVIVICLALLAWVMIAGAVGGIKSMLFGNPEVKRAQAETVVAEEQGKAARDTGIEAQAEVVRTYEYHTTVDRRVKEGQDAVNHADHGQQMDPEIDAAVAAGLCRLHDDLCRGD